MPNFMTRKSYEKLHDEYTHIREKDLPAISKAKQAAAEEGDLSENAEYHACKEKMEQLSARYRLLESRMQGVSFIDDLAIPGTLVSIGTRVALEDLNTGENEKYILLGSEDADIDQKIISIGSPIAKGLIGKKPGEEVTLVVPEGEKRVRVLSVARFTEPET